MKYDVYFWSESHLNDDKGYNIYKIFIRDIVRKLIIGKINNFCVPGRLAKEFIEKYAPKDSAYHKLPNLVDNEYYETAYLMEESQREILRNKYKISKSKFIFLLPARLAPIKGILEFLNIYKHVINKQNATILIAGSGKLKEEIENEIKKNKLDVMILGNKNQKEMLELYAISNCLLLPSLSDANPLTCIEALWAGLPFLVSNNVGNYPEIIIEGENGFVFNYKDIKTCIEKVNRIIELGLNKQWYNNAIKISREIALKNFSPKQSVDNFVKSIT